MKSTTLTALSLTLLMFLLVLLAAFFFVFQGQLALRDDVAGAASEVESLQQEQAQLQLERSSLQATATKMYTVQATSASENVELTTQLADTDRKVATLEAQSKERLLDLDLAEATRDFHESTGPLVTVVEPFPPESIVGEETELVIVASDVVGVKSVTISVDDRLIDVQVTPGQSVTVRQTWIPDTAGQAIITISAVNSNNVTSQPAVLTVQVQSPSVTATPVSTLTPQPTSEP